MKSIEEQTENIENWSKYLNNESKVGELSVAKSDELLTNEEVVA